MQTLVPPIMPFADTEDPADARPVPEALIALYNRTVNSTKGYAKMVEKAEPSFRDTAEQFRALHARQAGDMVRLLAGMGIEADADGTLMGTLNQAVVTFRAFFDDIDEDVMDQIRSGEDWVLKAFEAALEEETHPTRAAALRDMQAELKALLADTSHLAEPFQPPNDGDRHDHDRPEGKACRHHRQGP